MKEARVEGYLRLSAASLGGRAEKWGTNGWPDRLVLLPGGRAGMLELKKPGDEPRPLQHERLERLADLGFVVGWANTFVGVDEFLERLCAR